jgi:hypothetical protein
MLTALASFSIDTSGLISYAEDIFNSLMPVYIPILGIVLGLAIVGLVYTLIKGAVRG